MIIVGRKTLDDFKRRVKSNPTVVKTLNRILVILQRMPELTWENAQQARANFGFDDPTFIGDDIVVFKNRLDGNRYRIVLVLVYVENVAAAVFAGTHGEYERKFGGSGRIGKADQRKLREKALDLLDRHRID